MNVRRKGAGSSERRVGCTENADFMLHGKLGHPARLSLGGRMKSQGFHPAAGAHSRLTNFTENADILSAFPWAEACEAKVRTLTLVLIRGWLASRKTPTSCRLFLGRNDEKPRFSSFR